MTDIKSINVLPAALRNQIAAGEVVERPSSVVKELVENSVDAGSSRIDVSIERGGQGLITVRDDGSGIAKDELRLAVTRHATSKISNVDDLSSILSFGFRGEALPSIASVSRFKIASKSVNEDEAWTLHVEGSEIVDEGPAVLPGGTSVEVRDLFYNVPARLKFLKTETTEARRCNQSLFRISLANPGVGFSLVSNGREQFRLPPDQSLKQRLSAFWSRKQCEGMLEFEYDSAGIKVHGLAGIPSVTQSRSDRILMYVNGRPVQDKLMISAVRAAYKGRLISREYPLAVVFLEVPPKMVDVNVHPAKMEVRFQEEKQVFSAIRGAIAQALSRYEMGLFEEPQAASSDSGDELGIIDSPRKDKKQSQHQLPVTPGDKFSTYREFRNTDFSSMPDSQDASIIPAHHDFTEPLTGSGIDTELSFNQDSSPYASDTGREHPVIAAERMNSEQLDTPGSSPAAQVVSQRESGSDRIPGTGMDYLGQVADTYLVLRLANGSLGLLDQHAAHERVLYANMRRQRTAGDSRPLAMPLDIALHSSESEKLQDMWEELRSAGFMLETSESSVAMRGIPPTLEPGEAKDYLRKALSGEARTLDDLWIMLSCKSAIKAGQPLARDEAMALLETWVLCPEKEYCPHGRPVFVSWSAADMEKLFKRK